jgi:hypothetical protein
MVLTQASDPHYIKMIRSRCLVPIDTKHPVGESMSKLFRENSKGRKRTKRLVTKVRKVSKRTKVNRTRTLATLRPMRAKDRKQHGTKCNGVPGCTRSATHVFHSVPSSLYCGKKRTGKTITLCPQCKNESARLLFENANKVWRAA